MLEWLSGTEVGSEREGTNHLGGADRPLDRGQDWCDRFRILRRHVDTPYFGSVTTLHAPTW